MPSRSRLLAPVSLAIALMVAAPARAFQEVPTPAQPEAGPRGAPGISLDFGTPPAPTQKRLGVRKESKGGILPKLDFGLDLLYQEQNVTAPPALTPQDEDMGVMGTVKRRF